MKHVLIRVLRIYDLKLFKNKFYEAKFIAHLEANKKKKMGGIFSILYMCMERARP